LILNASESLVRLAALQEPLFAEEGRGASSALPDGASQMINASTRAWAQNNPGVVEAYRAAIGQASSFIASNSDKAKDIIAKYLNLPEAVVRASELPRFVAAL
jgi:ABC-type nitrate/sulfonate/bicarbonate transport system substrate-binding protein